MIREGQAAIETATGRKVFILSLDADPAALVWVSYADNPDADAFLRRDQIAA